MKQQQQMREVADPINDKIYLIDKERRIVSVRDFYGNVYDVSGNYIGCIHSTKKDAWNSLNNADIEQCF